MFEFREADVKEAGAFGAANGIFWQTAEWAKFRSVFRPVGFVGTENGKTVLSCVMLLLPTYLTRWSVGYIPRGFVCDYTNRPLVTAFTEYLKAYLKKRHVAYVVTDPQCDYRVNFEVCETDTRALLEGLGYERNNGPMLNPRTNYRLPVGILPDAEEEKKRLYSHFSKRLQGNISTTLARGVTVERCRGDRLPEAVEEFYRLLTVTTEMKGFGRRTGDYYRRMARDLAPYVTIYLYWYHRDADLARLEPEIAALEKRMTEFCRELDAPETPQPRKDRVEKERRETEKQLVAARKHRDIAAKLPEQVCISAHFFLHAGKQTYVLFGGNDPLMRELKLTSTYWDMICDTVDAGAEVFNMGGTLKLDSEDVRQDSEYNLYQYKKQYDGELSEMPGEYFLVENRRMFRLLEYKLRYFRRVVFRF